MLKKSWLKLFYAEPHHKESRIRVLRRRLAARQARVRISARRPRGGPLQSESHEDNKRVYSTSVVNIEISYLCSNNVKINKKRVAVCHQTFIFTQFSCMFPGSQYVAKKMLLPICTNSIEKLKGIVSRDFLLQVLFMNQFPPSPREFH